MRKLDEAAKRLARGDREGALEALLVAWRSERHPRLADLIDRVSAQLDAARDPIKGKTVGERTKSWHEIDAKHDPADLGRLLATPWPGRWQDALPILEKLAAWPDDPRLAMALARVVDAAAYQTWTSGNFWRPLFARFDKLKDPRTLPLLEAQADRKKSYYRSTRKLEERSTSLLRKLGTPKLSADADRSLKPLEAMFASDAARERSKASGEKEMLAGIYAAPDDTSLRQVYADWLSEQGDPRGELITLQRGRAEGRATPEGDRREKALLAKHGRAWAGPLDAFFEPEDRVFEDGFLAGGRLRDPSSWRYNFDKKDLRGEVDRLVVDPAWATIRTLEMAPLGAAPLGHLVDKLPHLRSVLGVQAEPATAEILKGKKRGLAELGIRGTKHPGLDACTALPGLESLWIEADDPLVAKLAAAPVARRLKRVVFVGIPSRAAFAAVAKKVRRVEIRTFERGVSWLSAEGFRFAWTEGEVTGSYAGSMRWGPAGSLTSILNALPPTKKLRIAPSRAFSFRAEERAELDEAVARFRGSELDLPWADAPAPRPPAERRGPKLELYVIGDPLFAPGKAAKAVRVISDGLGFEVDALSQGYSSKHRPLGDDPAERIESWAKNKRCDRIKLYQDGAEHWIDLGRTTRYGGARTDVQWKLGDRSPDDVIATLKKLLEMARATSGAVHISDDGFGLDVLRFADEAPMGGWIMVFGPELTPVLPAKEVAALREVHAVEATARHLIVRLGEAPAVVPKKTQLALQQGIVEIVGRQIDRRLGYQLRERVDAVLGPVARSLGLGFADDEEEGRLTNVTLAGKGAKKKEQLVVTRHDILGRAKIEVELRYVVGRGSWYPCDLLDDQKASTKAEITKALERAAPLVEEKAAAFFAEKRAKAKG
jgi:uncharacterized protein (TIGR02996 family)